MKKLFLVLAVLLVAVGSSNLFAASVAFHWTASQPAPDGTPLSAYRIYCDNTPGVADLVNPIMIKSTSASNLATTATMENNLDWFCVMDVKDQNGNVSAFSTEFTFSTRPPDVEPEPNIPTAPTDPYAVVTFP